MKEEIQRTIEKVLKNNLALEKEEVVAYRMVVDEDLWAEV
jgi:hypothetical protein